MQYLKAEVRQKILIAATNEFNENGFLDASIRTIADNAGISLGNIYRYFTNKEALFCAVVEPLIDEIGKKIEDEFVATEDISKIVDSVVDFLWANKEKLAIIQQCNNIYFDNFKKLLTDKIKYILENFFVERTFIKQKVSNPNFSTVIAGSFLYALNMVAFDADNDLSDRKRKVKELVVFFFVNMDDRFKDC